MPLRMWMIDFAREQSPTLDHLYQFAGLSLDAGYDAVGLYLEHRFAFDCAPWAQGKGCLTPEMVKNLGREFPSLQIIPFINLLGHMEGFLNCEEGNGFRETPFRGMQGCPSNPDFVKFCGHLLDETLSAFDSQIIHLGGDETWELASCPTCREVSKSEIYGRHFGNLASRVVSSGRTPALWGDMLLENTEALERIPPETILFDWQYFGGVKETATKLARLGHKVVGCPTLHVYDSAWMHLGPSEANIREVARDSLDLKLEGVCLTTWESGLFGAYDTLFPAIRAARTLMDEPEVEDGLLESYGADQEWARLMGVALNEIGGVFAHDGHRNRLKSRLLLYGNPFLAWKHHAKELSGANGIVALELCERAIQASQDEGQKGVAMFVRGTVEFVRLAEAAHVWYSQNEPEKAIKALAPGRHVFETLETIAKRTLSRIGGSRADIERCRIAKDHVERVISRIQKYGRGELGYTPSFDTLSHPHFVPNDQACWWGVNKWGDE